MQLRYMHEHHARPDVCVLDRNKQQHTVNTHYEDTASSRSRRVCLARVCFGSPERRGRAGDKPTATASLASLSFRTSADRYSKAVHHGPARNPLTLGQA